MTSPEHLPQPRIKETLTLQAHRATQLARSDDFLHAPYNIQQEGFGQLGRSIKVELDRLCGESHAVDIDCRRYYAVPDASNYINSEHEVDQHDVAYSDLKAVSGSIVDVLYVEAMIDYTKVFRTLRDYTIGGGAPCLVVRNGFEDLTYFVPMLSINDVLLAGGAA